MICTTVQRAQIFVRFVLQATIFMLQQILVVAAAAAAVTTMAKPMSQTVKVDMFIVCTTAQGAKTSVRFALWPPFSSYSQV